MTIPKNSGLVIPAHIREELGKSVKGQKEAIDCLAFIARLYDLQMKADIFPFVDKQKKVFPKPTLLLTGGTGCGKTFLVKQFSKALGLPYTKADCSQTTGDGWVGISVVDIVREHLKKAPSGHGVLHLDEFDKILPSNGSEESGGSSNADFLAGKMSSYLELLDGDFAHYPDTQDQRRGHDDDCSKINNALIICTGSFQQARDRDKKKGQSIGFLKVEESESNKSETWKEKMARLGYLREISGRICRAIELEEYTKDDVIDIIKNGIESPYHKYLNVFGSKHKLSDEDMEKIAEKVLESETGLRELNSLLFEEFFESRVWEVKE